MEHRRPYRTGFGWLALGPIIGLALLGLLLKWGMMEFKNADRMVSVKGVAERDVKANLATWTLKLRGVNDDLAVAQGTAFRQKAELIAFFKNAGVTDEEISTASVRVVDKSAQEYGSPSFSVPRYLVEVTVQIRSANVDLMASLGQKTGDILAQGILLFEDSCGAGPAFSYTQLNTIKPEMIAEATKSAKTAAQQFAKDSGAQVGSIRNATQGYFSIIARDAAAASPEGGGGGCMDAGSLYKTVRVVTTLNYGLR